MHFVKGKETRAKKKGCGEIEEKKEEEDVKRE